MDLSKLYGPGYAGYLQGVDQSAVQQQRALQGLGLLSNMQRQAEQNKLLEQQVHIARLNAEKAAQMQDIQRRAIERVLGGGASQPMEPTGTTGMLREPDPLTGEGGIPLPVRAPAAAGGAFPFNASDIGMLALAGVPGAPTLMKGFELSQPKMEFHGGQAFDMRRVPSGTVVPQTNQQGFSTMTVPDGQGGYRVVMTPGAAEAFGTQQRISEEAKGANPIAQQELALRAAEMADKGIRVPSPAAPAPTTGAIVFPSNGRTQPGQMTPQQILQNELAAEQAKLKEARSRGDLNGMAAAQRNISDIQRELGNAAQQPVQQPAQQQTGLNISPAQQRKLEEERPQATYAYRTNIGNLEQLASTAKSLLNHPGLSRITGLQGALPNIPGGPAANAQAILDTLNNKIFINTIQAMRDSSKTGGAVGNVSDREGSRLENAIVSLKNAQGEAQMRESLQNLIDIASQSEARLSEAYNMTYGRQREQIIPGEGMSAAPARVVDFNSLGR